MTFASVAAGGSSSTGDDDTADMVDELFQQVSWRDDYLCMYVIDKLVQSRELEMAKSQRDFLQIQVRYYENLNHDTNVTPEIMQAKQIRLHIQQIERDSHDLWTKVSH